MKDKKVFLITLVVIAVGLTGYFLIDSFVLGPIRPAWLKSNSNREEILNLIEQTGDPVTLEPLESEEKLEIEETVQKTAFNEYGPFKVHSDFLLRVHSRDVNNPRVMIFDDKERILVSEPAESRVSIIEDGQRKDLVTNLNRPHGLAIHKNKLYVAETGQIVRYDYDQNRGSAKNPQVILDLPAGGRHWTRTIGIGPDEKLYISIGSSCNICIEKDWRRTKILQYDLDTQVLRVYASGLRNAVFFQWHPGNGQLFATEMGRDWLGDDLPPDELVIVKDNTDYGYPYCYGKNVVDPEFDEPDKCNTAEPSLYDFPAHEAPLGIDFHNGDAIVALHGSWNRSEPVGYKVIRLLEDSNYQIREVIMEGWLQDDGSSIGRPAGILVSKKGEIYISDDKRDVIYRLVPRE